MSDRDVDLVRRFHDLHRQGCFVIPNPWDQGSAHLLEQLGFSALATTSSGFAWTTARADAQVGLEDVLEHVRLIAGSVQIPVNADFEAGYAVAPEGVAENVLRAAGTGVAGLSIEDATGEADQPLFDLELAVERVRAARQAIDASATGVLLTARSEGFIVGRPDLPETLRRLTAYAEAGADCLYAPGIRTPEQVSAVVAAVAPRPVNLLINAPFLSLQQAADLGVRRISVGGALAKTAWAGFLAAAREIAEDGTFTALEPAPDVNAMFRGD